MKFKLRDFDFDVKASDSGKFSGYGSVFGNVDSANEIVAPGAFAASLADRKARGRVTPVLWQHDTRSPIGVYDVVSEDSKGLYVEGRLLTDEVAKAAEAFALMKAGAVSGLSIGYFVRQSSHDEKTGVRTLTAVDLEEISVVTVPANDAARIDAVKMKLAHGTLPTIREFEEVMRDAGFSKSQAVSIARNGYSGLRDAGPDTADLSALIAHASAFSLPKF